MFFRTSRHATSALALFSVVFHLYYSTTAFGQIRPQNSGEGPCSATGLVISSFTCSATPNNDANRTYALGAVVMYSFSCTSGTAPGCNVCKFSTIVNNDTGLTVFTSNTLTSSGTCGSNNATNSWTYTLSSTPYPPVATSYTITVTFGTDGSTPCGFSSGQSVYQNVSAPQY